MLNKDPSFSDQISTWLFSIGYKNIEYKFREENFTVLDIHKNDRLLLQLKLVDIDSWNKYDVTHELELYAKKQSELRLNGVNSVILWEDQWQSKADIIKSRLLSFLGISVRIPGRLTYVTRIDKAESAKFLKKNHLQGVTSSKYQFGLYLPIKYFRVLPADFQLDNSGRDLLVAVATFSYVRIFIHGEKPFRSFELIRFSSLINTTVVGGMNKLLSAFSKEMHPDDIMTYIDLEWSDGTSYRKLGFEEISRKPPVSFWLDTETNERFPFRNETSDRQMIKICNAGSLKFVKVTKPEKKEF